DYEAAAQQADEKAAKHKARAKKFKDNFDDEAADEELATSGAEANYAKQCREYAASLRRQPTTATQAAPGQDYAAHPEWQKSLQA
ncbi:hypothetical protein, partial [Enterococcus faecium]|uniref:hypothetical protein n=1 Tax=Enterococcus faecium TaxID=1352 RepID=UPI003DA0C9BB